MNQSIAAPWTLLSPFCLYTLLLLLAATVSEEKGCLEFDQLLNHHYNQTTVNQALPPLIKQLLASSLLMDTVILAERQLSLNESFIERTAPFFYSNFFKFDLRSLDGEPLALSTPISNDNGHYRDRSVTVATINARLILFCVLRVDWQWYHRFDAQLTTVRPFFVHRHYDRPFHLAWIPMMRLIGFLPYVRYSRFSVTHLQLCSRSHNQNSEANEHFTCDYQMTLLLPHADIPLQRIEYRLLRWWLSSSIEQQTEQWIDLRLPRFNLNMDTSLVERLKQSGLRTLFRNGSVPRSRNMFAAIFRSITPPPAVEQFKQSVRLVLDETGLFDGGYLSANGSTNRFPKALVIEFNRPFMFIVQHVKSRTVLYIGALRDPPGE